MSSLINILIATVQKLTDGFLIENIMRTWAQMHVKRELRIALLIGIPFEIVFLRIIRRGFSHSKRPRFS